MHLFTFVSSFQHVFQEYKFRILESKNVFTPVECSNNNHSNYCDDTNGFNCSNRKNAYNWFSGDTIYFMSTNDDCYRKKGKEDSQYLL